MPQRPGDLIPNNPDFEGAARRALQDAAAIIGGTATTKYMRTGGVDLGPNRQTGPGSLRRGQGRLARSLTGARSAQPTEGAVRAAPEGVFDLSPTRNGVQLTYGSRVPYAGLHEYGGRRPVTEKQRGFFWGKYMRSGEDRWKAMALSKVLTYPERPYLGPALSDKIGDVRQSVEEEAFKVIIKSD